MNFDELRAFAAHNPILSLGLVAVTIAWIGYEISRLFRGYAGLTPAALTTLINHENALVVDLRPSADFQKGHIAGSKNVQMSQFDPESKQLAPVKEMPVVLVCQNGITVGPAAKRLKKAGFRHVYILEGGISSWQQADMLLVKGRD